jgi:hypothetical protein
MMDANKLKLQIGSMENSEEQQAQESKTTIESNQPTSR